MNVKRVLTGIIGFPLVVLLLVFANKYIIDVVAAIIAIISMHEYINCCKAKDVKVVKWISYLLACSIAFIHVVPYEWFKYIAILGIPLILLILNMHVICSNMKRTFEDISYTLMGILYIVGFIVFLPLVYGLEDKMLSGKLLLGAIIISSWGTDVFAYLVGKHFGKKKFSKVSPNKSVEGCIGGALGAVIVNIIYFALISNFVGVTINLILVGLITLFFSVIGQIGDFAASVIKRHFGIKDFSNLFPGHGGMLDRIDSVIYIAPFAFLLFTILL